MRPADPVDPKEPSEPSDSPDSTDSTSSTSDMETASRETTSMDRRRFIHVLAVGGAAVLAGGVGTARAASTKAAAPKPSKPVSQAMQRELKTQEKNLADVLKVIRDYDLPPGSEPATVFRAMRARRGVR